MSDIVSLAQNLLYSEEPTQTRQIRQIRQTHLTVKDDDWHAKLSSALLFMNCGIIRMEGVLKYVPYNARAVGNLAQQR